MSREEGLQPQPRRRREPVLRQASPLEEIRLSCLKGNLQSVQRIIEAGVASVNEIFEDGWTALMVASNGAHPTIVQFLLEHDGDANISRPDGFTPLMAALTSSQADVGRIEAVAELLVKNGAEINVHNKAGLSPLLLAIKDNRMSILKLLILNGANVNYKDKEARTPLFYAAERGFKEIAQFLVDNGADISAIDRNGQTPSKLSLAKGHTELAEILRPLDSHIVHDNRETLSKLNDNDNAKPNGIDEREPESSKIKVKKETHVTSIPLAKVEKTISNDFRSSGSSITNSPPVVPNQTNTETVPVKLQKDAEILLDTRKPVADVGTPASNAATETTDTGETATGAVKPIADARRSTAETGSRSQSTEKSSEKKPERKSVLMYGLALGVGLGVILLYYVRTYYLKRN